MKEQGYDGWARTVYRYLETLKQAEVKASVDVHRLQKFTANTAIWLFVRDPETLDEVEQEDLATFCEASAPLKKAYDSCKIFIMAHKREGQRLDAWLARVRGERTARTPVLCRWSRKGQRRRESWLDLAINNGMVEGHVTKLKLIKRTMYGRAGFALLRQRVLHAM